MEVNFSVLSYSIEELVKFSTEMIWSNQYAKKIFTKDKIEELAAAFKDYKEETLNPLKEKYGDKFTWDELKMYKASL